MNDYYKEYLKKLITNLKNENYIEKYTNVKDDWYTWKEAICIIDSSIGRNTILCFLKTFGILDNYSHPILNNKDFNYFKRALNRHPSYPQSFYYDNYVYFIHGKGIHEIRKLLRAARAAGCNI